MKRAGTIIVSMLLAIGLAGCGGQSGEAAKESVSLKSVSSACQKVLDNSEDSAIAIPEDGDKTLSLHQPALSTQKMLDCIAKESKMPDATREKINSSKSDTTTQKDSWDNIRLTWNWDAQGLLIATFQEQ